MRDMLLVSDFDGTMYSSSYHIPKENIQAVSKFIRSGGNFIIATGRLFKSIYPQLLQLGITKGEVICHQGASIFDIATKKEIDRVLIDNKEAIEILKEVEKEDFLKPLIFYNDTVYCNKIDSKTKEFSRVMKIPLHVIKEKISDYIKDNDIEFTKILIICEDPNMDDVYLEKLQKIGKNIIFDRAYKGLYEAVSKDASKGNAIKKYAEKLGIKRENIIAVGDAENDISMLEYAGIGIATSNASDKVKGYADAITVSNDEAAIAKVIEDYYGIK